MWGFILWASYDHESRLSRCESATSRQLQLGLALVRRILRVHDGRHLARKLLLDAALFKLAQNVQQAYGALGDQPDDRSLRAFPLASS